eukprot:5236552-Amphidinium_carterae.1
MTRYSHRLELESALALSQVPEVFSSLGERQCLKRQKFLAVWVGEVGQTGPCLPCRSESDIFQAINTDRVQLPTLKDAPSCDCDN